MADLKQQEDNQTPAGFLTEDGRLVATAEEVHSTAPLNAIRQSPGAAKTALTVAALGAALAGTTSLTSCKKESINKTVDVTVVDKPITASVMEAGKRMYYYAKANTVTGEAAADAALFEDVGVNPGDINSTYGFGQFAANARGYMSGIAIIHASLNTSASTLVPAGSDLDLEGNINTINGWLYADAGKTQKVATTFSAKNPVPAYMVDLRREDVVDLMVKYGVAVAKANPKGVVVDEADQASYFNNQYPGVGHGWEEVYRRIAWATNYGYSLNDEFQKDASGNVLRDASGARVSNIELYKSGGLYHARNIKDIKDASGNVIRPAGSTYDLTGKTTTAFSGIQPTPEDHNMMSNEMLQAIAYAGCEMALESRLYIKGGAANKTDDAYRAQVTERIMQYAAYCKDAGKDVTITSYEPAESNTPAGYTAAGVEMAKYWNSVRQQIEANGQKLKLEIIVGSTGPDGYFLNNNPQDFIENRNLIQELQKALSGTGITISYVNPHTHETLMKFGGEIDHDSKVPHISWDEKGTMVANAPVEKIRQDRREAQELNRFDQGQMVAMADVGGEKRFTDHIAKPAALVDQKGNVSLNWAAAQAEHHEAKQSRAESQAQVQNWTAKLNDKALPVRVGQEVDNKRYENFLKQQAQAEQNNGKFIG